MNAASSKRRVGPFLPQIATIRNKRMGNTHKYRTTARHVLLNCEISPQKIFTSTLKVLFPFWSSGKLKMSTAKKIVAFVY